MPQAIAAVLAKFGLSKLVATVIANVAYYSAVYSASRALAKRAAGKFEGMPIDLTREPAPARRVIYGRCRVGGPMLFAHLTGSANKELHIIEAYAGHEVDAIEDTIYVDDETYSRDVSGAVGGGLSGFMWSYPHTGFPGQSYDSVLNSFAPSLWTAAHDLQGTAYHYHRLKFNQGKWPYGLPGISAIVRGAKVYDPRTTATAYSDNPALCLRDYLTNTFYGMAVPSARIDDDSFIAAANICDELVSLAAGGTEKRYRCAGVFTTEIEPQEVIESFLATMAGSLYYAGGKWRVHAGADRAVTRAAITEADLVGPINVRTRDARGDTANRVKGKYTSPADNWAPADFPAVVNSTYLAEDQGEELWMDLDLTWVFSASQAQRLAKIALERSRQDISVTLRGHLGLLDVQCGDVVPLTLSRYGWTNKPFMVMGWSLHVEPGGAIVIELDLREYAASMWDWSSGEETAVDPAPNSDLPDARVVADPTSLALTSGGALLSIAPDGTAISPLVATWVAPADNNVTVGGAIEIEYRKYTSGGTEAWAGAGTVPGDVTTWVLNGLTPGIAYDVRIRSVNGLGVVGAWVSVANHVLAGDTTAPAAPSGITLASPSSSNVVPPRVSGGVQMYACSVTFTAPTAADLHHYEYVTDGTVSAPSGNIQRADPTATKLFLYTNNLLPGFFWIRAVDHSGNASAWAGGGNIIDYVTIPAGTLVVQDANDTELSALKVGAASASSVRQVIARYPINEFVVLTGGANVESFSVSIANRGFSAKPDSGSINCIAGDMANVYATYDYDDALNSSSVARIKVIRRDSGVITAGPYRFGGELVEYN
jgi:hypothetical protein